MGDLFALLNNKNLSIKKSPISTQNLAELINLIKSVEISGRIAKEVFEHMSKTKESPKKIIDSKGLKQQSDPDKLEKIIKEILKNNAANVEKYKSGKDKLFGFFVGEAMKLTKGKANPILVNKILKKLLKS